ncbi:MAG: hypothetical protein ACRDJH_01280, partial [Thermomicrobiales bacterium]
SSGSQAEGCLRVDAQHPMMAVLTSSLHVFDAARLHVTDGTSLGTLRDESGERVVGDAVVVQRMSKGMAVTIAANLPLAIHRIQHGRWIEGDGQPAPDDTAPIDDDVCKCDDGIALSWERDRKRTALEAPEPDCPGKHPAFPDGDTPWFAQPIADELRGLLLHSICWAAAEVGLPLPMAWPWPRRLPAVGLISHDSDFNIDATARTTLRLLDEIGINSTWCMMEGPTFADRFSGETFALVAQAGHETALHYNGLDRDGGFWGFAHLQSQAAWLRTTTGGERIASNKNHFTRWEGDVEFFRWLENAGIASDQSKGPSKKGNVGYPFGSCQPWFPFDLEQGRFIDVVEIPLQTQDLWLTTPYAVARPILDQSIKHGGVAHFLFHQVHLDRRPEVADAMRRVIADGRERGLEWWTAEAINDWERLRRSISMVVNPVGAGRLHLEVTTPEAVRGYTAAVIVPRSSEVGMRVVATSAAGEIATSAGSCHGQPALLLEWDLSIGTTLVDLFLG